MCDRRPLKKGVFDQHCPEFNAGERRTRELSKHKATSRPAGLEQSSCPSEQRHRGRARFTLTFEEQDTTPAQSVPPTPAFITGSVTPRCGADVTPATPREWGDSSSCMNCHPGGPAGTDGQRGRTESDCVPVTPPGPSPSHLRVSGATRRRSSDAAGEERGDSDCSRISSPPSLIPAMTFNSSSEKGKSLSKQHVHRKEAITPVPKRCPRGAAWSDRRWEAQGEAMPLCTPIIPHPSHEGNIYFLYFEAGE